MRVERGASARRGGRGPAARRRAARPGASTGSGSPTTSRWRSSRAGTRARRCPTSTRQDLTGSLYDALRRALRPGHRRRRADAVGREAPRAPRPVASRRPLHTPLLVFRRVSSAGGRPLEYVVSRYRGDRYQLHMTLGPRDAPPPEHRRHRSTPEGNASRDHTDPAVSGTSRAQAQPRARSRSSAAASCCPSRHSPRPRCCCGSASPTCSARTASAGSGSPPVIGAAGDALFANLPLLFAVGIAIGMARKSDGSTALAAVVGYLVFEGVGDAMSPFVLGLPAEGAEQELIDYGVLGGIVMGLVSAWLWQRYHRISLPPYLAFFGGRRFVPIVTALAAIVISVLMSLLYTGVRRRHHRAGRLGHRQHGAGRLRLRHRQPAADPARPAPHPQQPAVVHLRRVHRPAARPSPATSRASSPATRRPAPS